MHTNTYTNARTMTGKRGYEFEGEHVGVYEGVWRKKPEVRIIVNRLHSQKRNDVCDIWYIHGKSSCSEGFKSDLTGMFTRKAKVDQLRS